MRTAKIGPDLRLPLLVHCCACGSTNWQRGVVPPLPPVERNPNRADLLLL